MAALYAQEDLNKMLHKSFEILETKADAAAGTFEATVAVFGNVDKGGDRIQRGAFKNTLAKWEQSGDPIPVILSHSWDNPFHHIGVVEDAKETDKGLWVKGRLDVKDNDVARQVHRLMQRRSLKEFSFGYSIPKGGEKRAKDGANDLLEIEVAEVGPTLKGMNPATELHAVKTALGVQPDPETLRKDSERMEREIRDATLPEVTPPPDEPGPSLKDLQAELAAIKTELAEAKQQLTVPKDPAELREESKRLERDVHDALLPEVKASMEPITSELEKREERFTKELQEVKDRLSATEKQLEDLKKKAEETDKAPEARSVDPLRTRSEELALEVASAGMSLRKPPAPVKETKPETVDTDALKRQSRDLMLEVLSYSTE